MDQIVKSRYLAVCFFLLALAILNCRKDELSGNTFNTFKLSSPEILQDSILPREYTCDGESATLPLMWSGFPAGTRYFVIIMHHEASSTDIHWYWLLYNIPVSVCSLSKNAKGAGILGNNSVNGKTEYAPPCSKGPGAKKYIYTVYALSDSVSFAIPPSEVSREILLDGIKNTVIESAQLTVIYSRDI